MPDNPGGSYSPYRQLVLARFREFIREPAAVFWVYGFPLVMMFALGMAFRDKPVEKIDVVVQTAEASDAWADDIVQSLADNETINVWTEDADEARRLLRLNKTNIVVARATDGSRYEYFYDSTRPGSEIARNKVDDLLQRAAGREDRFTAVNHEVAEPGGRYIDFLVPGMLGIGIMGGGLFGLGYAIVDMRIRKVLKRLMATPVRRSQFLAAVMTSRFVFTFPEVLFLLLISWFFFGVVVHGNIFAVFFLIFLGTIQFAGLGLLVAARAKTVETVSGLINLAIMPMWLASGVFFPYTNFPEAIHPLLRLLPLTPLVDSLRAVMLEGATLTSQASEIGVMSVWAVVSFVLALRWFRWND